LFQIGHCEIFLHHRQNKLAMLVSITIIKVEGWLGNVAFLQYMLILNFGMSLKTALVKGILQY